MSWEEMYDEEMLLQTLEKSASEVQMEQDEDSSQQRTTMDPKVGFVERKFKDVVRLINKHISAIVVECGNEFARSFRTTETIRNSIMECVERQAKVAKETT
ncbi:hypothetical protein Aduo_016717 [Ancylostoma duodenale]